MKNEQGIIEAYKRGDKIIVIEKEFGIKAYSLYCILHKASVPLRSEEPRMSLGR